MNVYNLCQVKMVGRELFLCLVLLSSMKDLLASRNVVQVLKSKVIFNSGAGWELMFVQNVRDFLNVFSKIICVTPGRLYRKCF